MRQPQTLGEWIFYLALSAALMGLGVLFFLDPPEPIPDDPSSYREHVGLLEEVMARESGRRHSLVRFRIIADPSVYESRFPGISESSKRWRDRQTTMIFYTPASSGASGTPDDARPVYGLVADRVPTRTLEADIRHENAKVSPWAGAIPLGIGLFGYLVAGLVWWRRRAP